MNSIYTEYANLSDENKQWLDGCGATLGGTDKSFLQYRNFQDYIVFNGLYENQFTTTITTSLGAIYTHIPTGDEFCQRVAEILGIDKPTFGDTLTKGLGSVLLSDGKEHRVILFERMDEL